MRGLMAAVIGMGVLILVGATVLVVLMVQRMSSAPRPNASAVAAAPPSTAAAATTLTQEPAGTHIAAMSLSGDRLALQLAGGGPDRVVILDARTGRVLATTSLAP